MDNGVTGQHGTFTMTCGAGEPSFSSLFKGARTVELMSIGRVATWFKNQGESRLRLPPIQRSFVWRNEQIINYWDSLMRGFPAGMMMVTKVDTNKARQHGRGLDNKTELLIDSDFQLFDGQQRLTAILLGLGAGSLASSLQLWVDIGSAKTSGDRLFELRINSIGQPFGYKPDAPNEKVRAEDRHTVHTDWPPEEDGTPKPPQIIFKDFSKRTTAPLISAKCAVPLSDILSDLITLGREKTEHQLQTIAESAAVPIRVDTNDLLTRLRTSLDAEIIVNTNRP